jgi:hypothetical protein
MRARLIKVCRGVQDRRLRHGPRDAGRRCQTRPRREATQARKERGRGILLPMQLPNGGLMRRALSMAGPRCSFTIAKSHSRRLLILLPWISLAIAWSRSKTSCLRVMRWTASTCHSSIPHRQKTLLQEIVSGQRDPRKQLCPLILQAARKYSEHDVKQFVTSPNRLS